MNSVEKRGIPVIIVMLCLLVTAAPGLAAVAETGSVPGKTYNQADIVVLVAYILLALVVSFLCSVAEAVLLSITPSYIEGLREKHARQAMRLKRLRQDKVDQSLAAILTLNTIAHTVGAIVAGAKAAQVFGSAWIGLFSGAMTLMILFLSEIVPKTIGAVYWPYLTSATAVLVNSMIYILFPLIWVSERLTRLIARGKNVHVFSREEFMAMAHIGEQSGHIDAKESRIIRNLFRFGSLKATDIMTPRIVIAALPGHVSVAEAMETIIGTAFSRLLVYGKDIDDVIGFVLKDEILMSQLQGRGHLRLETLKRGIAGVPWSMTLSNLLEFMLDNRQHIVLVVDEYGGTRGLVTLEDVVETLLGMEIMDEMDTVPDMRKLARQQWAKRAKALGVEVNAVEKVPQNAPAGEDVSRR